MRIPAPKGARHQLEPNRSNMANTFSQIFIHLIFAAKNRDSLISKEWENRLYAYLIGIADNYSQRIVSIGGYNDHIHILAAMNPSLAISDFVRLLKCNSSKWINENHLSNFKFEWQTGYAVFTCSKSQIPKVISYIERQNEHHKKQPFYEEYRKILMKHDDDFDVHYLFQKI